MKSKEHKFIMTITDLKYYCHMFTELCNLSTYDGNRMILENGIKHLSPLFSMIDLKTYRIIRDPEDRKALTIIRKDGKTMEQGETGYKKMGEI